MTAKQLKLTDDQHEGLVKTLAFLREHPNFKQHKIREKYLYKLNGFVFSMCWWNWTPDGWECGSAHCIGGTSEYLMGKRIWAERNYDNNKTISCLFFPHGVKGAYDATPIQAADVLEHYLMTGEENWKEIINVV